MLFDRIRVGRRLSRGFASGVRCTTYQAQRRNFIPKLPHAREGSPCVRRSQAEPAASEPSELCGEERRGVQDSPRRPLARHLGLRCLKLTIQCALSGKARMKQPPRHYRGAAVPCCWAFAETHCKIASCYISCSAFRRFESDSYSRSLERHKPNRFSVLAWPLGLSFVAY
jgi:hypothetical protein